MVILIFRVILYTFYILLFSYPHLFAQDTTQPFFNQFRFCVCLVEKINQTQSGDTIYQPLGTAFWVRTPSHEAVLVSNKHVFSGRKSLVLRMTPRTGSMSAMMLIQLEDENNNPLWLGHPNSLVDIAIISLDRYRYLNNIEPKIISIQQSLFGLKEDFIEGDDVFFIGYPLGVKTTMNSFPLLRSGSISLKPTEDFLITANNDTIGKNIYLLDAFSIGGSSGSPVFLRPGLNRPFIRPNAFDITALKFVGIISGHVIDLQQVHTSIGKGFAEGNAALAIVHPADQIVELLNVLDNK